MPEPARKGGRRKEFCNDACKNRRYRQYKQEKRDADMLEDPIWEKKYRELYVAFVQFSTKTKEHVQKLEEKLKYSEEENERKDKWDDYYHNLYDNLRNDYEARLKVKGFSEKEIEEFRAYWEEIQGAGPSHIERLHKLGDRKKIQELEQEIDTLKQEHKQEIDLLRQEYKQMIDTLEYKIARQAKGITDLTLENHRLKDMLDERKGTSLW